LSTTLSSKWASIRERSAGPPTGLHIAGRQQQQQQQNCCVTGKFKRCHDIMVMHAGQCIAAVSNFLLSS
jgi:hypothetical protein